MKPLADKPSSDHAPAVIRSGEVYSLAELCRRLRWGEHASRQARIAGLRLVKFGREKYAIGDDVLDFFKRLAERQNGNSDCGSDVGEGQ